MTVEPNFAKCSSVRDTLDKLLMRFFFLGFRKKEPITLTRSQPEVDGDDDGDDDDDNKNRNNFSAAKETTTATTT